MHSMVRFGSPVICAHRAVHPELDQPGQRAGHRLRRREVAVAIEQSERAGTLDDPVIARFADRCALEVRQQRTREDRRHGALGHDDAVCRNQRVRQPGELRFRRDRLVLRRPEGVRSRCRPDGAGDPPTELQPASRTTSPTAIPRRFTFAHSICRDLACHAQDAPIGRAVARPARPAATSIGRAASSSVHVDTLSSRGLNCPPARMSPASSGSRGGHLRMKMHLNFRLLVAPTPAGDDGRFAPISS